MEALVTLGFACNIIQLVEASCQIASAFKEAYKDGTTKYNSDLESTTQSLSTALKEFKETPSPESNTDEKELVVLGAKVALVAESLYDLVRPTSENGQGSTRNRLKTGWRSLRDATTIKDHEARLRQYQRTLNTTILVHLRKRISLVDVQNREDFSQLGILLQNFVKEQVILQQSEFQKIQNAVRDEGITTRTALSDKLDAMVIDHEKQAARQRFLDSLRDPAMNGRKNDISYNYAGTFEWILNGTDCDHDELDDGYDTDEGLWWSLALRGQQRIVKKCDFSDWLIAGHDNYWICGKAGSGKSTLMRFIVEHDSLQSRLRQWAGIRKLTTVQAYIWNAGSVPQKSYKGVIATVLFQLLDQMDVETLDLLICDRKYSERVWASDWANREIEELILNLVQNPARCFCLFIDGLDELETQRQLEDDDILLRFISRISAFQNVKCCVSSRPERMFEIFFHDTKQLRLERLNARDIRRLCSGGLDQAISETQTTLGESERQDLRNLVNSFVKKSGGVFLWAHLVLGQIRRGLRAKEQILELHKYLDSLPSEISQLYEHMWARNNENLLQHREEAANFISLVLFVTNLDTILSLITLNLVQLAFLIDPRLQSNPFESLRSGDIFRACMRFKERVPLRTAGLLRVVDDPSAEDLCRHERKAPEGLKNLRKFKIRFIHRTAKDFLLTESAGQKICSEATTSTEHPLKRFLHVLLLERSILNCHISDLWLKSFMGLIRKHEHSINSSDVSDILSKLEIVYTENAQKHLGFTHANYASSQVHIRRIYTPSQSLDVLLPLDFTTCVVRHGIATLLSDLLKSRSGRLHSGYCAYLLAMFRLWHIDEVDDHFCKLLVILSERLHLRENGVIYNLYMDFFSDVYWLLRKDSKCNGFNGDGNLYVNYGLCSSSAVRCTIGGAIVSLMFGQHKSWHDPKHFHRVLPLVASFLRTPHLSSTEFLVLRIKEDKRMVVDNPNTANSDISSASLGRQLGIEEHYGVAFLMEYDVRQIFRWYSLRGQRLHEDEEINNELDCKPIPDDRKWNVTVKAIGRMQVNERCPEWCRPSADNCNVISEILSRLPILPCPFSRVWKPDLEVAFFEDLYERADKAWTNTQPQEFMSILTDLEYIVPADDPRVLKQAPPMFLDNPVDRASEDSDEEDTFFDAVE